MKHPLARALRGADLSTTDVATRLTVDPKTVERWLAGRVPYPRYRAALVKLTGWNERDLWPQLAPTKVDNTAAVDEVRVLYPHRSATPIHAWRQVFSNARQEIGILAYSALFLAEDTATQRLLRDKARAGVRVRIALGDPDGEHIARRSAEEGIHGIVPARIRNALVLCQPLADEPGVQLRLHDTILYNSIFRGDDELLINTHVYGCPASHAPVIHVHRADRDSMATDHLDAFERIWATAHHP